MLQEWKQPSKNSASPFIFIKKTSPFSTCFLRHARDGPSIQICVKPEVDGYVEEGDKVEIGNLIADILLVPGHSWGHICLVIEDNIIAGDTLFAGSVGRVDLTGGTSMEELLRFN